MTLRGAVRTLSAVVRLSVRRAPIAPYRPAGASRLRTLTRSAGRRVDAASAGARDDLEPCRSRCNRARL